MECVGARTRGRGKAGRPDAGDGDAPDRPLPDPDRRRLGLGRAGDRQGRGPGMTQLTDAPSASQADEPESAASEPSTPAPASRWRRWLRSADLRAPVIYLLMAGVVTERAWFYLRNYIMAGNQQDQTFFEWALANAVRVVVGRHDPFVTDMMNVPDGVNMMANTSAYGLTIPLIPVTMLFGPHVSFAVMVTLSLAATAYAWYWFFSRHLVDSRLAAFVGGAFGGFGPGMISQANAHPNLVAQFVLPLIIAQVLRLAEGGRTVRHGILLGLLVTYQAFLNEELLFVLALCLGLFTLVWALHRRAEARALVPRFVRGLGVGALVAGVLLAYPLYQQFFGRQVYHGLWSGARFFGADLFSFTAFSGTSLSGDPTTARVFAQNSAEQNSFFGWPLVVFCGLIVVIMWRHLVVRSVAVVGVVFGLLSLGPVLLVQGRRHHVPTPYLLLQKLPIFDSVITTRLALVLIPVIAVLLALFMQHVLLIRGDEARVGRIRLVAGALVVAVLLPLAPTRLAIVSRTPTPEFITSGTWKAYVPPGHTLVPVPLPAYTNAMDGMQWASTQRPTTAILAAVNRTGRVPRITDVDRDRAKEDLKFWRAAVVVLSPRRPFADALRETVTALLDSQPPRLIQGAWVWDVRWVSGG